MFGIVAAIIGQHILNEQIQMEMRINQAQPKKHTEPLVCITKHADGSVTIKPRKDEPWPY